MSTKDTDYSAEVADLLSDTICSKCNIPEEICSGSEWGEKHSECPFSGDIEELCNELTPFFLKMYAIAQKAQDYDDVQDYWDHRLEEADIMIDNGYEPRYAYE